MCLDSSRKSEGIVIRRLHLLMKARTVERTSRVRITIPSAINEDKDMIIGIDVSKDKLDIAYKLGEQMNYCQIENKPKSIRTFFKRQVSDTSTIKRVIFEATGGYERGLQRVLTELGLNFNRVHPNRVYHFAKAKGRFAKTDKIDADVLREYGEQLEDEPDTVASEKQGEIQGLSTRKQQLKDLLQQERKRLHGPYLDKAIQHSLKRHIKHIEKELERINEILNEAIKANQVWSDKVALLQSICGVGPEIATTLLCQLPELGSLSRAAIANLVGVAPRTNDSGRKQGYRPIGHGRYAIRRMLYMAALVAMRFNQVLKKMYERLIAKGKKPKVALVALMRKLVITMNAMLRDNKPWQSERI